MIARGREELESNRRDRTGLPQKVIGRGYVRERFWTVAGADRFLHIISPGAPDAAPLQSVPEPSCVALLLAGLAALMSVSRRLV